MRWLIVTFLLLLSIYGCGREKEEYPITNTVKPEVEEVYLEQREKTKEEEIYLQKAESCIREGEYKQAALFLKRAIELDPTDASLYYKLGNVYSRLQENELAVKAYVKAIELDPEKNFLKEEKP
ncbi:MAG: tetratricopeptide repeat protein [bacterium]|nr:tetratricopeptide repeat protein [bacterium]